MSDDPNKLRLGLELDDVTKQRLAKSEQQRNVVWPVNRTLEEKHKWTRESAEKALDISRPRSLK